MKNSIKQLFIIGIAIMIISILNFFQPVILNHYKYLILLLIVIVALKFTTGIELYKDANDKNIIKNILIYIFIYYLITYLSGLFIGFNRTIYSYKISNLTKNIIPTFTTIMLVEFVRNQFIRKSNKDLKVNIFTFIMIVLLESSIYFSYYNFSIKNEIYEYIGLVILSSIARNILMMVLNNKTDVLPGIIYRILMEEIIYVVIIEPALGPYLKSVCLILLPIIITYLVIKNEKMKTIEKPKIKKKSSIIFYITVVLLTIMVLINSGYLRYQSLVIGSNSMLDYMKKGDVIIVERLKPSERDKIEVGEILVFKYSGKIISHRVSKRITRPNAVYFITKGDNNSQEDNAIVSNEQIIGTVKLRIKNIGLPSIWLSELFD